MPIEAALIERSQSTCELCGGRESLGVLEVSGGPGDGPESNVYACAVCRAQIEDPAQVNVHHWRCLNESMWSEVGAVQVLAWRMLKRLSDEGWARELLETLYLEPETQAWAEVGQESEDADDGVRHLDSNGTLLSEGDTVVLIKDLNVKGAGFTAKRGTAVRGISLVASNAKHIEGRIDGQQIVILTQFVKKQA